MKIKKFFNIIVMFSVWFVSFFFRVKNGKKFSNDRKLINN